MGGATVNFALGLPHTPWVPERVESFARLRAGLGLDEAAPVKAGLRAVKIFDARESNRVWPGKLWRWAIGSGASHLVQLQDDVIPAPNFWPALAAMTTAVPDQILGLEAAHPLGPEMRRTGRAWYRTRAWLIGVGYVSPIEGPNGLRAFVAWCDAHPELVESSNEDSLVSNWAASSGFDIWHPVPTIIDHDLGVPSTYQNDAHHEFSLWRKPTVTWRDVERVEALESPDYWRLTEPPLLPGPGTAQCWFCAAEPGRYTSQETGARIGKGCLSRLAQIAISM